MVEERGIEANTHFGKIIVYLKYLMFEKGITIYQLSKLTKIKYDTIKNYYEGTCCRYDDETLSKICYTLKCDLNDIIKYIPPN